MPTQVAPTGMIPANWFGFYPTLDPLDTTAEQLIRAVEAVDRKPFEASTPDEMNARRGIRRALALPETATTGQVVDAIRRKLAAPEKAVTNAATDAKASVLIENAIAERRFHRSQRKPMRELARSDYRTFQRVLAASTEVIGFATAQEEFDALVEQEFLKRTQAPRTAESDVTPTAGPTGDPIRQHNARMARRSDEESMRTRAAARHAIAVDQPELAAEVVAERSGATPADHVRFAASAELAVEFTKLTAAGKSPAQAIAILGREHPTLVRARSTGQA